MLTNMMMMITKMGMMMITMTGTMMITMIGMMMMMILMKEGEEKCRPCNRKVSPQRFQNFKAKDRKHTDQSKEQETRKTPDLHCLAGKVMV